MVTKGERWEQRDKLGASGSHTLLYIKQINNKLLPENYLQYLVIIYNGKESEKLYIYIYKTEPLCCTPKTNTTS